MDARDHLPLKPADFHILLTLLDGPLHGYGIMKEVERESGGEVRLEIGSLYRLLGRLLNDELLEMGDRDGRRQYYSLSRLRLNVLNAQSTPPAGLSHHHRPPL